MAKIYLDGEFVPEDEAKISVFDHGLLYGDGVFEGIRAYDGYVFKLDEHLDRLYRSARAIKLEIPLDRDEMEEKILETLRVNGFEEAYIRPVVTRGTGSLGIDIESCTDPSVIIISKEWEALYGPELYEEGLNLLTTTIRNQPKDGLPPTVKHLNYLTNVLALMQANTWGADEALMLDTNGNVSEGGADNVFVYRKNAVYTPPVINNLPGITRDVVIDLLNDLGYQVKEENLGLAEVLTADEVFLSGTAAEVAPVAEIDGRKIGDGEPGELALQVKEEFGKITGTEETGTRISQST
ncbi:MAG: branched-chain-amino-acid transaminase [Candidatus Bipolaricaulota bacterium]|nr:branched-chain-amino-acid transaminase [Candidatus Bipolaricaulota bacterium]MBS3791376.1 branched-chain-amino-acid transaminase [Candidatus Bipolaricaulota bacterium]